LVSERRNESWDWRLIAFPDSRQLVSCFEAFEQLTDQSPVDQILGSIYGKTGKQVESRVDQEECIAYQDCRRIRSETWDNWINDCGRHDFGQVDDLERETRCTSVPTGRFSGGMKAYLRRVWYVAGRINVEVSRCPTLWHSLSANTRFSQLGRAASI
jgi:hypothetical protein